ncbi:MAG: penicillin-binding protein activator, partial [Gammaproteobacteria bacterium]
NLPSTQGMSPTARGWVELADIERNAWLEPGEFSQRLQAWRVTYPNHPADYGLIAEIQARTQTRVTYPEKVAFLLPLSGPYAIQGNAVEEGLLAAYYLGSDPRPTLAFYDTRGSGTGASAALAAALADGANFVVGPLTADGVGSVASAHPPVPVLALNYLNGGAAPAQFFQFGLSPDEEARAVAERAISGGLERAVVLVPANDWGSGIASAFTQALTSLGGQVLASTTYPPGAVNFGPEFSTLFGLNASTGRDQQLAATLDQQPEFNQQRNPDIQFVFFAAPYSTARLIVPQISYYQGIGLPAYSLSDVYYPGGASSDLNGLRFPIMPWFTAADGPIASVRESVQSLFPQNWSDLAPLYALGYDAWRLVPLLGQGAQPFGWQVQGMTGILALGPGNVIQRRPQWAHYVNGRVRALAATPAP